MSMRPSVFVLAIAFVAGAVACSAAKNSEFEDAGADPDSGAVTAQDPGSLSSGYDGPGKRCLDTTKNIAACELCCEKDYATGYKVFTAAVDQCACQPSLCGGVCITDICANPPQRPVPNSPCASCLAMAVAGEPTPPEYHGGAAPELGATNCRQYGATVCLKDAACQETEQCKAACGKKFPRKED